MAARRKPRVGAGGKEMGLFQLIATVLTVMLISAMVFRAITEEFDACGEVLDPDVCDRTTGCRPTATGCERVAVGAPAAAHERPL